MSCDCREFQELLLDLAYGELGGADAARLEDHAAACGSCREELDAVRITRKLAAQLPAEVPMPSLEDAVLAEAAREAVRDRSSRQAIAAREPGFFDRLRATLLRPAFATAMAAAVVLAISITLYRGAEHAPLKDGDASGAPFYGPTGAVASSPSPRAMPPVAAAMEEAKPDAEQQAVAVASAEPRSALGTGRRYASAQGGLGTAGPSRVGTAGELDRGDTAATAALPSESAGATSKTASQDDMLGFGAAGGGKAKREAARSEDEGAGESAAFDRALAAYNRGDCAAATPLFARIADDPNASARLVPNALHHLALCARRSGSCGRAIVYYERLLSEWPVYSDRPDAMWEAASCHRRLGHAQQALALLDKLEGLPGWADRVQAEKTSIERSSAGQ
jgi:TolA-binding protein